MTYQSPTLTNLIQQGEQQFLYRFPSLKRNNVITVINRVCAALSASEHMHIDWLARQIIPTTADEEYLIEYALYKGISRKMATAAKGVISVEAVQSSVVAEGAIFQHSLTGLTFRTTQETVLSIGVNDVEVQCQQVGEQGNLSLDTKLSSTTSILGVKPTVTIKKMSGGSDIEPLSRLLARLVYRMQYPPAGGAVHDYVRWATEVPGVTRAWCFPRYMGGGTVGVAFVCDDRPVITPTNEDISRVKTYISGHRNEVTGQFEGMPANTELFVFSPKEQAVDFVLKVSPDSPTLRRAVEQSLRSFLTNAGVGAILYLSQIRASVSNTVGEVDNAVISPSHDIVLAGDTIAIMGDIQWQ